ncbi:MAG: hypothetical protein GF344_02720 [Chitinivibrionales bacterium]|nr:hypothetical protein [Chitinivibrionales bacterium]MBD3355996.1 hypothetical protein [Chitinivibrionales bacterium]
MTARHLLLLSALLCATFAHGNPFRSSSHDTASHHVTPPPRNAPTTPAFGRLERKIPFVRKIFTYQRTLTTRLSRRLRSIQQQPGVMAVAGLLFLSFIYGMVHSLGPGHAKVLFLSHTFARPSTIRQTWLAGGLFSLTHAGTSIALFLVLRLLLGAGQGDINIYSRKMMRISGALVLVAGILIVASTRLEHLVNTSVQRLVKRASGLTTVAVFAGFAPCPGAFLILVFTSILGMLPAGLIAVGAVSLGMAVTVSTVTSAGGLLAARISGDQRIRRAAVLGKIIRFAGATGIILLGLAMIIH